ncbi:hypothetical protein B0J18DRAFT_294240 [Chaetomium sp. MPI-SDFR-AT-0129]|nr:hypothetical protein B0J18DRAFT_294240 [Chaetomium sp. MPI-SDFR-AT-0129]
MVCLLQAGHAVQVLAVGWLFSQFPARLCNDGNVEVLASQTLATLRFFLRKGSPTVPWHYSLLSSSVPCLAFPGPRQREPGGAQGRAKASKVSILSEQIDGKTIAPIYQINFDASAFNGARQRHAMPLPSCTSTSVPASGPCHRRSPSCFRLHHAIPHAHFRLRSDEALAHVFPRRLCSHPGGDTDKSAELGHCQRPDRRGQAQTTPVILPLESRPWSIVRSELRWTR